MKAKTIFLISTLVVLASCSLDQEYYGSSLTQSQYEKLSNTLEGSMRGIYSQIYAYSAHDQFGQRSIDMYTDLMCGDMALTNYSYGWFYTDERNMSSTARTSYLWSFYYKIIHNSNLVINIVKNDESGLLKRIAEKGLPNNYNTSNGTYYVIEGKDTLATYSETDAEKANYYAQALTMRGYAYTKLLLQYTPSTREVGGVNFGAVNCFPIYNEENMDKTQPLATIAEAYQQVESDLGNAIAYFDAFESSWVRSSKLEVNSDVAAGLLAYSYLNKIDMTAGVGSDTRFLPAKNAAKYAIKVINSGKYTIISDDEVYGENATGFNDVNCSSWIWGQDVTTETQTGLGSFFGQVDIHSYSYAWAGDTKACDALLFAEIPDFDSRQMWFNDGVAKSTFALCPDGKFFSNKNQYSTQSEDIDREWLSDNVFMRIEAMYLIAAEAYYRMDSIDKAIQYLTDVTDNRVMEDMYDDYDIYIAGLNKTNLLAAIEYNWRVEMWGEGYGLQTFRRLSPETCAAEKRRRGGNHAADPGGEVEAGGTKYYFQIPSAETSYNPNLSTKTLE